MSNTFNNVYNFKAKIAIVETRRTLTKKHIQFHCGNLDCRKAWKTYKNVYNFNAEIAIVEKLQTLIETYTISKRKSRLSKIFKKKHTHKNVYNFKTKIAIVGRLRKRIKTYTISKRTSRLSKHVEHL